MRFPTAAMLALALLGAGAPAASGAAGEPAAEVPRLRVVGAGTVNARVAYGEAPAYGYGLSPQNVLTKLPPGDERDVDIDFRDWAEWAVQNAVTIARSYPPSAIVGPRWIDLFERSPDDPARFDLRRFDERYFARLREACLRFRDDGIFVHLQLWQAVYWKKDWPGCYYHPANNVNPELCAGAGPGGFVVDPARHPELVAHQREHVRRILDATGDLGNVFYDVMNEIGNGTGVDPAWVEAILDEIEAWEQEHDIDLIVGLNDEGHDRVEAGRSLSNPRLDVAFLDLGRFDQPVATRRAHGKPTFGIRNIDWNPDTAQRFYFAGEYDLSINSDPGLLDRTQRMYWRMFMAGVMMNAGYADYGALAYRARRDDLGLGLFRAWNRDGAEGRRRGGANPTLSPHPELVLESPTRHSYCLAGDGDLLVFLESVPGTSGQSHAGRLRLAPLDGLRPGPGAPVTQVVRTGQGAKVRVYGGAGEEGEGPCATWQGDELVFELERFDDQLLLWLTAGDREGIGPNVAATLDGPGRAGAGAAKPGAAGPVTPTVVPVKVHPQRAVLWAKGNVAPGVIRYEWQRRNAGAEEWEERPPEDTFLLADDGLVTGKTYEYRARAVTGEGRASAWSAPRTVTPERPSLLRRVRFLVWRYPGLFRGLFAGGAAGAALLVLLGLRSRRRARSA